MPSHFLFLALLALASSYTIATDPTQQQDYSPLTRCLQYLSMVLYARTRSLLHLMISSSLDSDKPGNALNPLGSKVTPVFATQIPGLNTLGISMARIDFAPYGLNPPHTHPRATEILTVLEGSFYVGFVTSNPDNKLFTKVLNKGDVFVFPQGLIHFQFNKGKTNAVPLEGLSSQNPGVITIANAVFGSKPPISDDVLAQAFQVDKKLVDSLQAQFWMDNNYRSVPS